MSDKPRWLDRFSSDARKQATQTKIMERVKPHLQASEQLLCPPAPGTYFPWGALVSRNRMVRWSLTVAAFPITLVSFVLATPVGLPASFVITDQRSIVVKRRVRTRVTSLAHTSVVPLEGGVRTISRWNGGGADVWEVCEIKLRVQDRGQLRLRFGTRWLDEGGEIASALFHMYGERSDQDLRRMMNKFRKR